MKYISFTVEGNPVPKGRPRTAVRGGKAIVYTPSNTVKYEQYVKLVASQHKPKEILTGAIDLSLDIYIKRPKSLPKKVEHNIKKPDVDNIAKLIMDALEGVIYERDAQVISLLVTKQYGEPRVEVGVYEV